MRAVECRKGGRGVIVVIVVVCFDSYRIRIVVRLWLIFFDTGHGRGRGSCRNRRKPTSKVGGHLEFLEEWE